MVRVRRKRKRRRRRRSTMVMVECGRNGGLLFIRDGLKVEMRLVNE